MKSIIVLLTFNLVGQVIAPPQVTRWATNDREKCISAIEPTSDFMLKINERANTTAPEPVVIVGNCAQIKDQDAKELGEKLLEK